MKTRAWTRLLLAPAAALLLVGCDVDVEDKGALPDVDVSVDEGRMPDVDVDGPEVTTETMEVEVPKIEIPDENEVGPDEDE